MTAFTKENVLVSTGGGETWLYYRGEDGTKRDFIARFRRGRGGYKSFYTFLIKNFTVEEYFDLYNQPPSLTGPGSAPTKVLETKGYISDNIRKAMKIEGVSTKEELLEKMRLRSEARMAARPANPQGDMIIMSAPGFGTSKRADLTAPGIRYVDEA